MEDIEDCRPDEPNLPPKRIENVGEEFMDWAEKYWSFKRIVRKRRDRCKAKGHRY